MEHAISVPHASLLSTWRQDLPASVVVFLVALPLCLGIALASGAPLFSGIIAGVVGGLVIGLFSKSPLSVSGPAAGLTVIVLGAIQSLPSFEAFLLAVLLAGALQILLGSIGAGMISEFFPASVIKGMLAAIGLILILKQIPHALGYDASFEGDESFWQPDGRNTFSTLMHMFHEHLSLGAIVISSLSLAFLFAWDAAQKNQPRLRFIPGPLVVVAFGVLANLGFASFYPGLALGPEHLVAVPVASSIGEFFGQFRMPDFAFIGHPDVWKAAGTLALVASIETLLSIEAIDKLDPLHRITPRNRELLAQGIGNMASGLIGGLPVTSVIVRSSANVNSGAVNRLSTLSHGALLLLSVIAIPGLLNLIPLSALAAVLIAIGYKLTRPTIFHEKYKKGWSQLVPFVVTIAAILFTDLLVGILIGLLSSLAFVLRQNLYSAVLFLKDDNHYLIRFRKDVFFIHKFELRKALERVSDHSDLLFDFSNVSFMDYENIEMINDFIDKAERRDIKIFIKSDLAGRIAERIHIPDNVEVAV